MNPHFPRLCIAGIVAITSVMGVPASAQSTKALLGVWAGKATGPEGGPPNGDITVTFEREKGAVIKGRIVVMAKGGVQYSGQVSDVTLKNRVFEATAVFKLGENPLEVRVTGPFKGNSIEGSFTVTSKGQKMGDGSFAIKKQAAAPGGKKKG